jgi:hypothetical protein
MATPPVASLESACESCAGRALGRAIEIENELRTVQYQCESCGHEWYSSGPAPSPGWTWNGVLITGEPSRIVVRIPVDE